MTVLKTAAGVFIGMMLADYVIGAINLYISVHGLNLYPFIH